LQRKYLQTQPYSYYSRVEFSANNEESAEEFVLFFHPQNQQAGLLVDIGTLAGYFLCMDNDGYVVADSHNHNPPADKFLIVPTDETDWW
jgi:hypothetical protein